MKTAEKIMSVTGIIFSMIKGYYVPSFLFGFIFGSSISTLINVDKNETSK